MMSIVMKTLIKNQRTPKCLMLDLFIKKNQGSDMLCYQDFMLFLKNNGFIYQAEYDDAGLSNDELFISYLTGQRTEKIIKPKIKITPGLMKWHISPTEYYDKTREIEFKDAEPENKILLACEELFKGNYFFTDSILSYKNLHYLHENTRETFLASCREFIASRKYTQGDALLWFIKWIILQNEIDEKACLSDHLRQGVKAGYAQALYWMGEHYIYQCQERKFLLAYGCYRKAAIAGHLQGVLEYANTLLYGSPGVYEDTNEHINELVLSAYDWLPDEILLVLERKINRSVRDKIASEYCEAAGFAGQSDRAIECYARALDLEICRPVENETEIAWLQQLAECNSETSKHQAIHRLAYIFKKDASTLLLAISWMDRAACIYPHSYQYDSYRDKLMLMLNDCMQGPDQIKNLMQIFADDCILRNRPGFHPITIDCFHQPRHQKILLSWFMENNQPEVLRCAISDKHPLGRLVTDNLEKQLVPLLEDALWEHETTLARFNYACRRDRSMVLFDPRRSLVLVLGFFSNNASQESWNSQQRKPEVHRLQ